jgi:DNA invertase Pin-like site-specific DNA recombinase
MKTNAKTKAACYVRMSSSQQERSPEQQRTELTRLAEREGCDIVRWESDEAICGDSGAEHRPGLRALLAAAKRKEFSLLLVDDLDRLGRQDSIAAGPTLNMLRQARVQILTVSGKRLDLTTSSGRLYSAFESENANDFLQKLSRRVGRGQEDAASRGWWCGSVAPHGFQRAESRADGRVIPLEDGQAKGLKSSRVTLIPGDAQDVKAVRFAFNRFDRATLSYRQLAAELNAAGYRGANGAGWFQGSVQKMLSNPAYAGRCRRGQRSIAKFAQRVGPGQFEAADVEYSNGHRVKSRKGVNPIEVPAKWDPLVDVKQFDRVQRKIAARKQKTIGKERGQYLLRDIIRCPNCNKPMIGHRMGDAFSYYTCATFARHGKHNSCGCGPSNVRCDEIERFVIGCVARVFLQGDRDRLAEFIHQVLVDRATGEGGEDRARIQAALEKAEQRVRNTRRLVKLAETEKDAQEAETDCRAAMTHRDALAGQLESLGSHTLPAAPELLARELADAQWDRWEEALQSSDRAALRDWLLRAVACVAPYFQVANSDGPRTRYRLVNGEVLMRDGAVFLPRDENHLLHPSNQPSRSQLDSETLAAILSEYDDKAA